MTRVLSVWRADPASPSGVAPDELLPRLPADDATPVADYLDAGAVVARTTARVPDPWSDSAASQVPLTQRTDGVWRWNDAVGYYVRRYHLNPSAEFLAYVRERAFVPPSLTDPEVSAVIDEILGTDIPSDRLLRLDGSQLLPRDRYCIYQGRVLRCRSLGRGEDLRIRMMVSPGQTIPDGFEPKDTRDAFVQVIAFKTVLASDVEAVYEVISSCWYKGAPFSIERIDGPQLRVSIGGGRRLKRTASSFPRPTRDEWGHLPNVEVLGVNEIWADIGILEAAKVTMAVVPYHVIAGTFAPVHDPTGAGYVVPAPDQIFYFLSLADSPYLPPAEAITAAQRFLATTDPNYPRADLSRTAARWLADEHDICGRHHLLRRRRWVRRVCSCRRTKFRSQQPTVGRFSPPSPDCGPRATTGHRHRDLRLTPNPYASKSCSTNPATVASVSASSDSTVT